jgi:putative acetyltransferase
MITIRPETALDHEAIHRVNRLAFGRDEEARLVDALRREEYMRLSLVAEVEGEIIGHILFSYLPIITENRLLPALALAPMAVMPEHQRRGIGSELVRRGLELCREQGYRIVIVVGHPEFYPRFGFSAELATPLVSPFTGEAWMAAELTPGALAGVTGRVEYPPPFGIPPD